MIKTETTIAQENLEKLKNFQELYEIWNNEKLDDEKRRIAEDKVHKLVDEGLGDGDLTILSETHKKTLQRFLEFLGKSLYPQLLFEGNTNGKELIKDKITDIKNAIKLYKENGI